MDVRLTWVVLALLALVATLSVTEVVRVAAVRLRAVDHPGGRRMHRAPTARLGGVGLFWGFAAALGPAPYAHRPAPPGLGRARAGVPGLPLGAGGLAVAGVLAAGSGAPGPPQ